MFDKRFPADLERMGDMRRALRSGLEVKGVPDACLERLVLVVDEVVTNSIEHGVDYRTSDDPIRVCVSRGEDGLRVLVEDVDVPSTLVRDLTREFAARRDEAPEAVLERGRGMFLITMFLEDLQVGAADGGGLRLEGLLQESRY